MDSPEGVVEMYLPYAPVAAAVRHDVRTLILSLAVGLATFFAVMFRVVAGASRRLRRQTRELQESVESNRHQATHDALTRLPNRVLVQDRLGQALTAAARKAGQVAVFFIGLDRFKEINDILGHSYGDELLRQIGPRLREALREGDTVARLGGDEFAVLVPVVEGVAEARAIAERLGTALHRPFEVDGVTIDVEASIGITMSPWHGTETDVLMRNADIAMYAAKQVKAGAVMFRPEEHEVFPARLSVFGDLRRALDHDGELFLHYQPKFTLDAAYLEGAEALLRWRHPERGLISPAEFIPFAEGTGLILRLTEHVLDMALAQMRRWTSPPAACSTPACPGWWAGCSPSTACRPTCCGWRSPRARSWARPPAASPSWSSCTTSVSGSRSTTSGPATARWPTCAGCRSTS
jgi:diguanylate cyclase (GGDEF)-like protein